MSVFKREFIEFILDNRLVYEEREDRFFLFAEHRVVVVLVYLSDFDGKRRNGEVRDVGRIKDEVKLAAQKCENFKGMDILYLYEDRWFFRKEFVQKRILARLGIFVSLFARKCRVIDDAAIKADSRKNAMIKAFLNKNHSYGDAMCKYRYALEYEGKIVAVATFSAPRPMPRDTYGDRVIVFDSYEWVRYASLPDCRVVGGMGRLLKCFLRDISAKKRRPVEIMSYSDIEWSQGRVYESLGFVKVQKRDAVEFMVDTTGFERVAANKISQQDELSGNSIRIKNLGSYKYLYYPAT